jgi:hypothetical protein
MKYASCRKTRISKNRTLKTTAPIPAAIYQAEFDQDPTSHASSRSNAIAMRHTVRQIYGDAVARDVANLNATLPAKA